MSFLKKQFLTSKKNNTYMFSTRIKMKIPIVLNCGSSQAKENCVRVRMKF